MTFKHRFGQPACLRRKTHANRQWLCGIVVYIYTCIYICNIKYTYIYIYNYAHVDVDRQDKQNLARGVFTAGLNCLIESLPLILGPTVTGTVQKSFYRNPRPKLGAEKPPNRAPLKNFMSIAVMSFSLVSASYNIFWTFLKSR